MSLNMNWIFLEWIIFWLLQHPEWKFHDIDKAYKTKCLKRLPGYTIVQIMLCI